MLSTFSGCQVQRPVLPGMSFKLKSYLVCAGVGAISRTPIQLWQCRVWLACKSRPRTDAMGIFRLRVAGNTILKVRSKTEDAAGLFITSFPLDLCICCTFVTFFVSCHGKIWLVWYFLFLLSRLFSFWCSYYLSIKQKPLLELNIMSALNITYALCGLALPRKWLKLNESPNEFSTPLLLIIAVW